ncbi:hypothetical protein VTN49DRAFT_2206 [Thermomyces lanuginosus]|uniref:uncharacterized protein n=1 Tax=Thermomyces lanuginosus TaxID=5541 RepID=UPI0037422700
MLSSIISYHVLSLYRLYSNKLHDRIISALWETTAETHYTVDISFSFILSFCHRWSFPFFIQGEKVNRSGTGNEFHDRTRGKEKETQRIG